MDLAAGAGSPRPAMQFSRLTRKTPEAPDFVKQYVSWGAGPRASQYLILGAKARAILHGRPYVSIEDVQAVAAPVLRHRILTNFNAEAEGIRPDDIVKKLTALIPTDGSVSRLLPKVFKTAGSN
jgi:MoxR-like ATPase